VASQCLSKSSRLALIPRDFFHWWCRRVLIFSRSACTVPCRRVRSIRLKCGASSPANRIEISKHHHHCQHGRSYQPDQFRHADNIHREFSPSWRNGIETCRRGVSDCWGLDAPDSLSFASLAGGIYGSFRARLDSESVAWHIANIQFVFRSGFAFAAVVGFAPPFQRERCLRIPCSRSSLSRLWASYSTRPNRGRPPVCRPAFRRPNHNFVTLISPGSDASRSENNRDNENRLRSTSRAHISALALVRTQSSLDVFLLFFQRIDLLFQSVHVALRRGNARVRLETGLRDEYQCDN